eukprot:39039-Pyramimonas_sp.AAC.1
MRARAPHDSASVRRRKEGRGHQHEPVERRGEEEQGYDNYAAGDGGEDGDDDNDDDDDDDEDDDDDDDDEDNEE